MATEAEVTKAGIVAGSASPIGLSGGKIIADNSITLGTNFIAGANKPNTHLRNANYPRDFTVDLVTDIARACAGESCPRCGGKLSANSGIEIGHTFKLGTFISQKLGALFVDTNGTSQPIIMGSYGIGLGRLLAAVIEQHHDNTGIIWPLAIAPYQVYLCPLYLENHQVATAAESLYADLKAQDLEVLFDDRNESPGVKFNDADLLGMPIRITISPRTLEKNSLEVKLRSEGKSQLMPLEGIVTRLKEIINQSLAKLSSQV
jgi:prolyl-tRNA synthetase